MPIDRLPLACCATAALLAGFLTSAAAQMVPAGDPATGRRLATDLCSSCHAVGDDIRGTDMAPSLPAVAAIRNRGELVAFLSAPHAPMPPVALTRQEVADLAAYIESLRPMRVPPARSPPGGEDSSGSGR